MSESPSIYDQIAQLAGQVGAIRKNNDSYRGGSQSGPYRGSRGGFRGGRGRGGFYTPRGNYPYQSPRGSYSTRGSRGYYPSRGRGRGNMYRNHSTPIAPARVEIPCAHYTRTGTCTEAKTCKYKHDPKHVALCIPFFKTGKCPKRGCTLNHKLAPENTPMCSHYARGRCNRDDCKFAHMAQGNVNNGICPEFALLGWCNKGLECSRRHVFECPDFETTGLCPRPKCHLQHVERRRSTGEEKGKDAEDTKTDRPDDQVNLDSLLDNLSNNFATNEQAEEEDQSDSDRESDDEVYELMHVADHDSGTGSEEDNGQENEDDSGFIMV